MEKKNRRHAVVEILNDYYGEDRVDLQDDNIYIYFPKVTVTNEYDKSIDITELYVKIKVDEEGLLVGTFMLNRAEYTTVQWLADYMHSHVNGIPKRDLSFMAPCLGRGPIKDTHCYLNNTFDTDVWALFALELDKYVHTESISGVPYRRLENVKESSALINLSNAAGLIPTYGTYAISTAIRNILDDFLLYIIEKRILSFSFQDYYYIADSLYNIVIKISNLFIEWYNKNEELLKDDVVKNGLFNNNVLIKCIIKNNNIYSIADHTSILCNSHIGEEVLTFKGNTVVLRIKEEEKETEEYSIIMNPDYIGYLTAKILNIINYKYGHANLEPNKEPIYI